MPATLTPDSPAPVLARAPQTIEEKAAVYGDLSLWLFTVACDPSACLVVSGHSGNVHLIAYDAHLGTFRCSCIAGRRATRQNPCRCHHIHFHTQEWMQGLYDRRLIPSRTSAAWDALAAVGGDARLLLPADVARTLQDHEGANNFATATVSVPVPVPSPSVSAEERARRRAADWD